MEIKKLESDVDRFIDELVQQLLVKSLTHKKQTVEIKYVVHNLLTIKDLIPEFVIDGDEFVKYFSRKRG
jgi:hypothetical protein